MNKDLIISVNDAEISIALLEDKQLVELNKEKRNVKFSVGDIYLGKVKKIMPGKVSEILQRIDREVDNNKQREIFESAFDEVHEEFLQGVKTKYPELTPTELRLCAYLKMNLPTKEIAPLLNISVRGVEICRYRIRKKMGITRDVNLTTHLLSI